MHGKGVLTGGGNKPDCGIVYIEVRLDVIACGHGLLLGTHAGLVNASERRLELPDAAAALLKIVYNHHKFDP